MLPLTGINVVSLEQAVAAPFATRQLADLGARVIKVERPGKGDFARHYDETVNGLASHFVWLNRSKESLALDLKKDGAGEVLRSLVARSDVFVQNLAPGAAERLGFGAERLREEHPRLVHCGISGYGEGGPYTEKKAYDLLVQCEAGLVSITGTEGAPSKVGISVADIAAGMYAYSGILSALFRRERTGEGATLEVSMLEALGEWMGFPAYFAGYGGEEPKRSGASHAAIAPYGPFGCADGQTVFLGIQNEREWGGLCAGVLGRPEMAEDERFRTNTRRVENREALHAEIERAFSRLPSGEAIERLQAAGVANARMRTVRQFLDHPQLEARERWREFGSPAGPLWGLRPPATMEGVEPVMSPIPAVGEHTRSILRGLGYDEARISSLKQRGVT
ncbi:MAG: L-carnitine dehydratase/bile acid-inducible protein F [uncultured Rubrobacteraceae bacterium]|uniref:L-carnitine dehydratase/bile acid-inducible protein F n=1 Tax=uncultured Rubrobacteraceae bacterium TaxID=349277 RepID=A0A6J4QZM6_9ACTN|nr:MAG: L-carnitine dehydratase/bile acid-inducible protein F [uncultured Rubrobacteraceae bacterium]